MTFDQIMQLRADSRAVTAAQNALLAGDFDAATAAVATMSLEMRRSLRRVLAGWHTQHETLSAILKADDAKWN